MTTIKDLPIDVVQKVLSYLSVCDEMAVSEAIPSFEQASEIQIETSTDLRIHPKKRVLVVVTSEFNCRSALASALVYYRSVHLILSRSVTEENDCDNTYQMRKFLEDITGDGVAPFKSLELVGRIPSCGCSFAFLTR